MAATSPTDDGTPDDGTPDEEPPAVDENDTAAAEPVATTSPTDDGTPDDDPPDEEPPAVDENDTAAAEPEPASIADPCAGHEQRTADVFIEVASPVEGQQVGQVIDLVGCSNVWENTVRYQLVQGGAVLVDAFTTADCGHGMCVGEFSASVDASSATPGPAIMRVFWDDAENGSERDVTELNLTIN